MLSKVSIVLVNYNGKKYLDDFMKSVCAQSYPNIDIVLVDNASEDGSVQWIEANYPRVKIMRMEQNEGFGQGCNAGIDCAIREGADYILLLNTDTVLETNLVEELVHNVDNNTVVTATIYCGDKSNKRFWYAGGKIDYETANVEQLLYINSEKKAYEVDFISGCCMMFHRNIIEQIGNFDRKFYLYYEDADFCVRLKQHGIKMKYITTTSLWHKVGGSSLGGSEMSCSTQYYVTRNRLLFAEKYPNYFIKGNLEIFRKILQEYAFFDGADNEQYEVFVRAAVSDYIKSKFEKGFYGKTLIEEHFFVQDGLGEREEDDEKFWYCAKEARACISIVNSQKRNIIYKVSFDIENINCSQNDDIVVEIEGIEAGRYKPAEHIEIRMFLRAEQSKKINIILPKKNEDLNISYNDKAVYYQLLNINVEEQAEFYYMGNSFMPEESDGQNRWCWSAQPAGTVYLINDKDTVTVEEVVFEVVPYKTVEGKETAIYQDGVRVAQAEEGKRVYLRVVLPPRRISKIEIRTDYLTYEEEGGRHCFNVHNLSVNRIERNYYMGNSFMPEESDVQNRWCWSIQPVGTVYLINDKNMVTVEEVAFEVVPYKTVEEKEIVIYQDGVRVAQAETGRRVYLRVAVPPQKISGIEIRTDYSVYEEEGGRHCFNVHNLSVNRIERNYYMGNSFMPEESDGQNRWCWSEQPAGTVYLINDKDTVTVEEVTFEVVPYKLEEGKKIVICQDEVEVAQTESGERIYLWVVVPPKSSSKIKINADFQICKVDEAKLCFGVYNLAVTELKKSIKYGKAFYLPERSGENIWRWCYEKEAEVLFILNEGKSALVSFWVSCDERYLNETLQISIDGEERFDLSYNTKICIPVSYDINRPIHKVSIKANHLPYKVEGDDRTFTFQLLDFMIQDIE